FIAALVMRQFERNHSYHEELHSFSEGFERLLMTLMLILFGGLVAGGLLNSLTWQAAVAGLAIIFVLRPVTAFLSLLLLDRPKRELYAVCFFGIRGIGSLYYLAYAMNHEGFGDFELLWSTVSFVVLVSMIAHGASAT